MDLTRFIRDYRYNRSAERRIREIHRNLPRRNEILERAYAGQHGRHWYKTYAQDYREKLGPDFDTYTRLLAALSPQQPVKQNFIMTDYVWRLWNESGRVPEAVNRVVSAQTVDIRGRVLNGRRALRGEPFSPISFKVNAFYRNLIGDEYPVTLDTHMFRFAGIVNVCKSAYLAYTAKIRQVAARIHWTPAEVQAAMWIDIRAEGQMSLFPDGNFAVSF